jgi:hypothetical protein
VSGNQNIFRHNRAGTDLLWFNFQSDDKLRLYISDGSNPSTTSTAATVQDTNWHFAAVTWDGATVKLFFDGAYIGSQAVTGTLGLSGYTLNVGGGANCGPILGSIDEPSVWSRALTYNELSDLYTTGQVPTTGLLVRYLFNEGSGSSATDTSGNANTGTITGATYSSSVPTPTALTRTTSTDRFVARNMGSCLSFRGGSNADRVSIATSSSLESYSTAITLAAWVYINSLSPASNAQIIRKQNVTGGYTLYLNRADNTMYAELQATTYGATANILPLSRWVHVGYTFDSNAGSNQVKFYLNGSACGVATRASSLVSATDPLYIGNRNSPFDRGLFGMIDEPTIYHRALTATEMMNLAMGRAVDTTNLVGRWLFDEGSGSSCADVSGNANTGTITSATWSTNVAIKSRTSV